ncbi:MAG: response regulator [Thiohalomonadales bacterium]
MGHWFHRYAYSGSLTPDTESEQLRKAILVSIATGMSILGSFWGISFLFLDRPVSASIPGGYAIFSMLSVLVFFKTRHYGFFRFSQLLIMLLLPYLLQWSLGGFNNGSTVMIWAILSPVGALMFHGVKQAVPWFAAYLVLAAASGIFDSQLVAAVVPLPSTVITVFYVMNVGCATLLLYGVVNYFVVQNKRIINALSEEKTKTEIALAETEQAKSLIEEQSKKLIEMDRVKSRFLANISHEFRTPLALTIGPLEDALNGHFGKPGEMLNKQLHVMLRNSRRLLRLINQLLDVSKVEAGEMKLNLSNCDLRKFTSKICQAFSSYTERKQIDFTAELGQQPIEIDFDREKMEIVLSNLLSNAVKFTPSGGRVQLILCEKTQTEHDGVQITVRDTGPGIAKTNLVNIFDRFYQVDGSLTREHEGTGIGLSLAKELVELHGGQIHVDSDLGFGAEFSVFIPRIVNRTLTRNTTAHNTSPYSNDATQATNIEIAALDIESGNSPVISPQNISGNSDTVLIVDDNCDIRAYLHTSLSNEFQVLQAANGAEGLKLARLHQPDLIISDIMMPEMDGYELCRAIKQDATLNHIPLIFLTAKASEDTKLEGLEIGADDYISKPFNAKELLVRSRNLITLRKQEKELKILNHELEEKAHNQLEELTKNKRLTSYFSSKLLQQILSHEDAVALVTERRKITIIFCDLCNFTDLSDRVETEQTTLILNEYLTEVTSLVEQHGATVIQIIGDAIMAFFGAPDDMNDKDQAVNAVRLGIAIQYKIKSLSSKWLDSGLEYKALSRIGIHQDFVTVGNFGSHNLMEYTAVGRGVNLASRLERSCTPGCIKVSQPVYLLTSDQFPFSPVHEECFKGFARQLKVCELNPAIVVSENPTNVVRLYDQPERH